MTSRHVPAHLRTFVVHQHYEHYTSIDQAVWRFVMRQNRHFLEGRAHPAYLEGLRASGISIEAIPQVEEMNRCLRPYGWGAETIGGFIPGVAFYDFQAHGILPIAAGIRKLEHIAYTPAPDILHEAAGHAPILCDREYSRYVKVFGDIGAKALASQAEHDVFAAVKYLSDILEDGTSSEDEIARAKAVVAAAKHAAAEPSEAELIARLYWWTVEYGLYGDLSNPLIYGAGLLSSVGESRSCLSAAVRKLPFDLETCIATPFDITTQQPQLFVCQSFDELTQAVSAFSQRMAFRHGGVAGLHKAVASGHTATIVYDSLLQVSGTLTEVFTDAEGQAAYLRFTGPTALAVANQELPGQGKARHAEGFSAPVGRLIGVAQPLSRMDTDDLLRLGLKESARASLAFASGVTIRGTVRHFLFQQGRLVLITWSDCTVSWQNQTLFAPSYGFYDMAVGEHITSVYADAADPEHFYAPTGDASHALAATDIPQALTTPSDAVLDGLYRQLRALRADSLTHSLARPTLDAQIEDIYHTLQANYPEDWLLRVEIYELLCLTAHLPTIRASVLGDVYRLRQTQYTHLSELIDNALSLAEREH